MAIIDVFGRVSDNQDLTVASVAGNILSTNVIDLTASGVTGQYRDVGRGNELALRFQVTEAFTAGGGGAGSLDTTIIVNNDGTSVVVALSNIINLAKWSNILGFLTLGAVFTLPVPTIPAHMLTSPAGQPGRRYLSVLYTLIGGDTSLTTGKITADFGYWRDTAQPQLHKIGYAGP